VNRQRRLDERLPGSLLRNLVSALARGVLGRLDPLPALAAQDVDKARTVCACHSVAAMPLARFIIAITSAFLLLRSVAGLPTAFFVFLAFLGRRRRR